MSNLTNNTAKLQSLLTKINELPNAEGIDTSDATATSSDMAEGVTAYVNGEKITGIVEVIQDGYASYHIDETPSLIDGMPTLSTSFSEPKLFRSGSIISLQSPLASFGNATAADVAAGKTFTSGSGLKATGTAVTSAPKSFTVSTSTANSGTLSITGLPKEDYGYLLNCTHFLVFGMFNATNKYVHSIKCAIGNPCPSGMNDNSVVTGSGDNNPASHWFNVVKSATVVEQSGYIAVTIVVDSGYYFTQNLDYTVVGFIQ